ncbi:hypothetical protein ES703_70508 [subsurface metagenome]
MLIVGLLFPILFGFIISLLIVSDIPIFERISIAYGLGFGLLTLAMFFLDVAGIKFSLINTVILISALMILSLTYLLLRHKISYPSLRKLNVFKKIKQTISSLSIFEGIIIGLLIFFLLSNIAISVYWPVWEADAMGMFDFRARVFAETESISEAARTITVISPGYFLAYPPLASLASTWLYLCGWATPKVFYPLLLISLAIICYYSLRDYSLRYHALLFTLIIVIHPAIYFHATASYINFPFAFYFAVGIMYLYRWMSTQKRGFLSLAGIFFALFAWTRRESLLFFLGSLAVLIIFAISQRRFFAPILFALLYFSVEPLWNIYLSAKPFWIIYLKNFLYSQFSLIDTVVASSSFIPEVSRVPGMFNRFFDFAHWRTALIWLRLWIISPHRETFYSLFLITLLCIDRIRKHLFLFLLVYLNLVLFTLAGYMVLMNRVLMNRELWKGTTSSAKRLFMIFPPIMWYFMALVTAETKDESSS